MPRRHADPTSRTKSVSAETIDPTSDPEPRAAKVTASPADEYGIGVYRGQSTIAVHDGCVLLQRLQRPPDLLALLLFIAARSLPATAHRSAGRIDHLGALLIAAAATGLVLTASFGADWGWASPPVLGLAVATIALVVLVVPAERRAAAPILPLSLFTSRPVVIASLVGSSRTWRCSARWSTCRRTCRSWAGCRRRRPVCTCLPLVIGLVLSQSLAGRWITDARRVRLVLVAGMAITVVGLLLLSTLGARTGQLLLVGAFLVTGIGIGMVPMVALTAAQNAVPVRDIGAASAMVTFFRSIGAAFGVTVFGALLSDDIAASIGTGFLWIAPFVAVGAVLAALLRTHRPR
ncbi:hypothetical protein BBK82_28725 [Lentzea guizhouensis]|uniref:Major facilitator superfamily (MFS) profile domain-containing protein n=1 Tax=Lentzea guizhouensis TaxID=1586287 RepID=A0A1B2HNX3_9PSEU|nr:hypothetical protein BBK82_28725 [Lentzea guizhouensis]